MNVTKKHVYQYGAVLAIFIILLIYPTQIFGALNKVIAVLYPVILGFVIAYVLNILSVRLESWYFPRSQKKIVTATRRPLAILVSLVIIVFFLYWIFRLVLPQFISALTGFFTSIPTTITQFAQWLQSRDQFTQAADLVKNIDFDWSSIQSKVMKYLTSGASGLFGSTVKIFSGIFSTIFNLILAFTFAMYLLLGKKTLQRQTLHVSQAFIPDKYLDKIRYVVRVANQMFSSFVVGQVTEAFVLGTLCILGMWIFRFPNYVSIGAFVGIMALIPIFGAWIGGIVGFLLIVVDSPIKAILFIVFIIVLQQLEGNLIYPRVVGTSIGLPGIWVLFGITVGSGLGGFVGMFLGVPITATIYRLVRDRTRNRLSKQVTEPKEE